MQKLVGFLAASLAALAQAGCVHTVPSLTPEFGHRSNPTVNDIVRHIGCEIRQADRYKSLKNDLVTVLLTLQVDDTLDLTPSLGLTQNLAKPAVSLVTTLNADLGGARQRTFTTSYSFDVAKLEDLSGCDDSVKPKQTPYSLEGNLQINEIINDGLDVVDKHSFVISAPTNATDKSGPSFGSKVQFIITQSVTNFGPVWTLKYFKGGGGSNGLLNGKRLDTDSVLITFAPKAPAAQAQPDTSKALQDAINALTAAIERQTQEVTKRRNDLTSIRQKSAQLSARLQLHGFSALSKRALQGQSANLAVQEAQKVQEVQEAEDTLANTKAIADAAAATKLSLATTAAQTDSGLTRNAAASATQQLQLNMLLQNLTIGH